MLSENAKKMLKIDWHPKVPPIEVLKKQILTKNGKPKGKYSGSVRMALSKIATK